MDEKEILELFAEAKGYIAKLISGFEQIAAELKEDDATNMPDFADGVDGIIWLFRLIDATGDYHTIMLDENKMNQDLEAINSSLEESNYGKTANIILANILPMLKEWDQGLA